MMPHLLPHEVNDLGEAEIRHAIIFAFAVSVFTMASMLIGTLATFAIAPDLTGLVFIAIFALGGAIVMLMLILGFRRGRQHRSDYVDAWRAREEVETALKKLGLKEKPKEEEKTQDPFPFTHGTKASALIAEFDVRDLESLCLAFSLGAKWSEKALVDKPLPVTREILTRTRHEQLMTLLVAASIVGGRDGDKRLTGKLLLSNPDDMMTKLRALTPALPANV